MKTNRNKIRFANFIMITAMVLLIIAATFLVTVLLELQHLLNLLNK